MKILTTIFTTLIVSLLLSSCGGSAKKAESIAIAETFFTNDSIVPGNIAFSSNGRIFISANPLSNPYTKVYEITPSGVIGAYPNDEYVTGDDSIIEEIIALRVDSDDNLWLLDMAKAQFIVWDTKGDSLLDVIQIPDEVIRDNSYLQDFVLDEKHRRAIIADMTMATFEDNLAPAFIVVDLESGEASRIAEGHLSMMPDLVDGAALNPIAIDPQYNWVYYGSLGGKKIYRIPAANFGDETLLLSSIEEYGNKSYSDGILVDDIGNVYVTNIEDNALSVSNGTGFQNIALLPEGQTWPDGLFLGNDGYLYATVSQLGSENYTEPFIIVRTKVVE